MKTISLTLSFSLLAQSLLLVPAHTAAPLTIDKTENDIRTCFKKLNDGDSKKTHYPAKGNDEEGDDAITVARNAECSRYKTSISITCTLILPAPEPNVFIRTVFVEDPFLSLQVVSVSVELKDRMINPYRDSLKMPHAFIQHDFLMGAPEKYVPILSQDFHDLSYDDRQEMRKRLQTGKHLVAACNNATP